MVSKQELAQLRCIECGSIARKLGPNARCEHCGDLLEVVYPEWNKQGAVDAASLKTLWLRKFKL